MPCREPRISWAYLVTHSSEVSCKEMLSYQSALLTNSFSTYCKARHPCLLLVPLASFLLTSWWVCGLSVTPCPFSFCRSLFHAPRLLSCLPPSSPFLTSASSPHTLSRSASHYFYPPECGPAPLHANRKPQVLFCLASTQSSFSPFNSISTLRKMWHIKQLTDKRG